MYKMIVRRYIMDVFIDSISCMTDAELEAARDYIDRMLAIELEDSD